MYRIDCVFGLLVLSVGLVLSFSWENVISRDNRLEFYNEGKLTYWDAIASAEYIRWVAYDPVHHRVLFADHNKANETVNSYDIASRKTQCIIKRKPRRTINSLAYDPATELLYTIIKNSIYSFSLKPGFSNEADGNLVINIEGDKWYSNLAVDSCGGYIYWSRFNGNYIIERALFNGSEKEVISNSSQLVSDTLNIDQQTQKIYWIDADEWWYETGFAIVSADLNGRNRRTLYRQSATELDSFPAQLTVSKDFIFWADFSDTFFWKFPKNLPRDTVLKPEKHILNTSFPAEWSNCSQYMASNYKIEDQIQGVQNCKALERLLPHYQGTNDRDLGVIADVSLFCVNGTKVSGESRCECIQGYTGERCDVSLCHNYCLQGDCSVSAEGHPKCSCIGDYSGERCEVNACYRYCLNDGVCSLNEEDEPVCECIKGYEGQRCDVSVCKAYCFQGDCISNAEGLPECRCNPGYSGERCEVNACQDYCLNNGACSLNEESAPVCQCAEDYDGERCDVPAFLVKCFSRAYKNVASVTLGKGVKSTCASTV